MRNPLFCICFFLVACSGRVDRIHTIHNFTEYQASVHTTGISTPLTVMHITDVHISRIDSAESTFFEFSARMDKAYSNPAHYLSNEPGTKTDHFHEIIQKAKVSNAGLIVLTGDIVNNPSKSSINFISKALEDSGIEYLYVSGNHDWHYEGMPGTADELREKWINESLLPLYKGQNPMYYSTEKAGINFIGIDNSTYQINEQQLEFFKDELHKNKPTVLFCHIPIYPGLGSEKVSTCGDPNWGYDFDRNFEVERRLRWSKSGNLPSTKKFVELVKSAPNLIAILTGHTHRAQVDMLQNNLRQYRTQAAYSGAHRLVAFKPIK